jgi:hypothetical protein
MPASRHRRPGEGPGPPPHPPPTATATDRHRPTAIASHASTTTTTRRTTTTTTTSTTTTTTSTTTTTKNDQTRTPLSYAPRRAGRRQERGRGRGPAERAPTPHPTAGRGALETTRATPPSNVKGMFWACADAHRHSAVPTRPTNDPDSVDEPSRLVAAAHEALHAGTGRHRRVGMLRVPADGNAAVLVMDPVGGCGTVTATGVDRGRQVGPSGVCAQLVVFALSRE